MSRIRQNVLVTVIAILCLSNYRIISPTDAQQQQQQFGSVIGLNLIRGGSDIVETVLVDGGTIEIPPGTKPNFNIQAVVTTNPISSVIFAWNNITQYRTEYGAPYAFCGNFGTTFFGCPDLGIGKHKVSALVSDTLEGMTVNFEIAYKSLTAPTQAPVTITGPLMEYFLIYTPNNTEVMKLRNRMIVDTSSFPIPAFNIKVRPRLATVKSMRFLPNNQSESFRPFTYCGNNGTQYNTCAAFTRSGTFNITVESFTEQFQSGQQLPNDYFSFSIRVPVLPPTPTVITIQPTIAPMKSPTTTSPRKPPTVSPVRPPTKIPVRPPTKSPVRPPTKSPVRPLTKSPVRPPTKSPVRPPTMSPVRPPTTSPVRPPTKIPVRPPSKSPLRPLTNSPVRPLTTSPIRPPTKIPVISPTKNPVIVNVTLPTLAPIQSATLIRNVTFTLIYTFDNSVVGQLVDGMVINASQFERLSFNIRADSNDLDVKSMQFFPSKNVETSKPWAYCGNDGDRYLTCESFTSRGNYTITATPYSGTGKTGTQFADVTIRFSIEGATTPSFGFPKRINCGGTTVTDSKGQIWSADSFFTGGATFATSAVEISNTEDDVIYRTERYGTFEYNIPVPLGSYSVNLHFAELLYSQIGKRIFDLNVEGTLIADIDIIERAEGRANTSLVIDTPVAVADGYLTIQGLTNEPKIDNAKISAIEVIVVGPHYAHAVTGGPYTSIDTDSDGFELVPVDGSESHTHGPNEVLTTFVWKRGNEIIGTGEKTSLLLPTGVHVITLTATDTSGDSNTDTTVISVLSAAFPSLKSISPDNGYFAGGTPVTITGTGLQTVLAVRFGIVELTRSEITIVNSTTITLLSPFSGVSVPAMVSVINPAGESNALPFSYLSTIPIRFSINRLLDVMKQPIDIEDPTAVAFGPDSRLYVGTIDGKLCRYTLNDDFTEVISSVIVEIDEDRGIHGIAFDPMEDADTVHPTIYISTSDIFHEEPLNSVGDAINGKIQAVTGANMDVITNIVTGLPVSGLDHSVNGIYFGNEGELYIGIGSNTNGGIPGELTRTLLMRESYFSAAIVVANVFHPNFNGTITYNAPNDGDPITGIGPSGVEVFGAGTRNPYGVVVHSNGLVYATDNGPNGGFGDMATGCGNGQFIPDRYDSDRLHLIERGNYYGHPNHKRAQQDPRQCVWRSSQLPTSENNTAPLMRLRSSTNGIIEYQATYFNNELNGNLIAAKYKAGLYRIVLSPDGRSIAPYSIPAIELGGEMGLTVTQTPDGKLLDGRYETSSIYVYTPNEPSTNVLRIYSIYPRRGRLLGGSKLTIYGTNFDNTTIITVGTLGLCNNSTIVSMNRVICILPPSILPGQQDIIAYKSSSNETYTFTNAYRYIVGRPQIVAL